ncbi:hypothetical protein V5O48_009552 [Marasmius crinis-equi]|uniref:Uncharacterized protein n=1 Tax=Marasmius crinis-equi TaxID=585013 RepID=A0ABR3FBE7_9AGAR
MALYPLASAAGLRGGKREMRQENNRLVRQELETRSPCPPRSRWLKADRLNHPLMAPQMRVHDPVKAGSWFQRCKTPTGLSCQVPLELKPAIGIEHALLPPFDRLYAIREELREIPRLPKAAVEDARTQPLPGYPNGSKGRRSQVRTQPRNKIYRSTPVQVNTSRNANCSDRRSPAMSKARSYVLPSTPVRVTPSRNINFRRSRADSWSSKSPHSSPFWDDAGLSSSPLLEPATSSPTSSVIDLTLEDDGGLRSSPSLGPATSSPASPVIDLTLDDDEDETGLRTFKFWLQQGKTPVTVKLNAVDGRVTLAEYKMMLAGYGVERMPMEWWDKDLSRWAYLFWSQPLRAASTEIIKIRAVGVTVPERDLQVLCSV